MIACTGNFNEVVILFNFNYFVGNLPNRFMLSRVTSSVIKIQSSILEAALMLPSGPGTQHGYTRIKPRDPCNVGCQSGV